jgi:hypothetical protein
MFLFHQWKSNFRSAPGGARDGAAIKRRHSEGNPFRLAARSIAFTLRKCRRKSDDFFLKSGIVVVLALRHGGLFCRVSRHW